MQLFELNEGQLTVSPEALTIKDFAEIWKRDKTKTKKQAISELSFVFFMADITPRNVYRNYAEEERASRIIEDCVSIPKWKADSKVNTAILKYAELHYTKSMKLLDAAECTLDMLEKYFRTVDVSILDDKGKPVYAAKDVIANIEKIGKIYKGIKELKIEVLKEQAEASTIRGGGVVGIFEDE